ncbi:MAG: GNAT family N-acetyltransferase [Myxococcota bacterium]
MPVTLRPATPDDAETILAFIQALAEYEREPDAVEVDAETLRSQLAESHPPFFCTMAELDGTPVGFALWFETYSTWRGRRGIYLEDLFVLPEHRGLGIGRALLASLAAETRARGGARLEWAVLDWNTPAIDFYEARGAVALSEWTTFRLSNEALDRLADEHA